MSVENLIERGFADASDAGIDLDDLGPEIIRALERAEDEAAERRAR
ncbi:MAG TPA: hypothetical protein VFY57_00620 [Rubrobacteraceae bacterium]|nr:hypothetical protein [Rubrobacteraceae bacterium]